jgi:uncharacterized integral membrane protein (TIGR00698 family)
MSEIAHPAHAEVVVPNSRWSDLIRQDDWWAIWIGLGLVAVAVALFVGGDSIKWIAVAPSKWSHWSDLSTQLQAHAVQYAGLLALLAVLFGIGARALGYRLREFLPSFLLIYVVSLVIYFIGLWDQAAHYNLEPPLVALALGILVSNTTGLPRWAQSGLRVELFIKTGIVLLGAGLPLTLIAWAGPVAVIQAGVISLVTFGTIFFTGRALGLDRRLAAVLGTGGAVCGVSGSIAVAGAVGAKKEQVSIGITLVVFWAIVMIFALPLVSRALHLATGVAGAWIGTSEFADAAGLAAAQAYGGYAGNVPGIAGGADTAVNAFTLMKVIGRDIWIGVWAFALSIIATTRWEATGVRGRAGVSEIWRRFPKFVLGFLIASAIVTLVVRGYDYAGYKKTVLPALVTPLQSLRTWAFTFAFLAIGLTTRVREFVAVGARPFLAFTAGVVINVTLGFVLSTQVFGDFWSHLGQ